MPLIMIFVALGLKKLEPMHTKIVYYSAVGLIIINAFSLNANTLANQYPLATDYETSIKSLPNESYIVCNSGGNYGLDNYYLMASGKDIRPLFYDGDIPDIQMFSEAKRVNYQEFIKEFLISEYKVKPELAQEQVDDMIQKKLETQKTPRYQDYIGWMNMEYGLQGTNTLEQVQWLLSQNQEVYLVTPTVTPYWENVFETEYYDKNLDKIIGLKLG